MSGFAIGALVFVLAAAGFFARRLLLRWFLLGVLHAVYRIRVSGLENLPVSGALLVANHLSFADAFFVSAGIPRRRVYFLMYRSLFRVPVVGWFARLWDAIPVASEDPREAKQEALQRAAEMAATGELVCIFSEGTISRTGQLLPFARGLEKIARAARVPIVPVALDRVWGSVFSFSGGRVFWKRPQRVPFPIDVAIGAPMGAESESWRVRAAVQELVARSREARAPRMRSLGYRFVRSARAHAGRVAVVDSAGARIRYRELLRRALVLGRVLARDVGEEQRIGIRLTPGVDGVLANVAVALSGRAAVNLNPLLGDDEVRRLVERAHIARVITARRTRAPRPSGTGLGHVSVVDLDDLERAATAMDRALARIGCRIPGVLLARLVDRVADGTRCATVMFTSGSTSEPRGVVLSHASIAANVQSAAQVFGIGRDDAVLAVLPLAHGFGYTCTLWLPLLCGARAVCHFDPLDAQVVGDLARTERATLIMATPTLYRAYLRRTPREDFAHVRLSVSGGEALRGDLADAWLARHGSELLQGYGCTELAPVVAVNVPDVDSLGTLQVNHRRGTVGRAIPGTALAIVDPTTFELLAPGSEGLLLVRGANRMTEYLDDPGATHAAVRDGWYATGDLARIDRDAFLTITGRLARFSKIGGEMVSHVRVEEALSQALQSIASDAADGAREIEFAVVALPDAAKGERLAIVHTRVPAGVDAWLDALARGDLPSLMVPRRASFFEAGALPRLSTGKTDLRAVRELAALLDAARSA